MIAHTVAQVWVSFHLTVIAMSHAHVKWSPLRPLHWLFLSLHLSHLLALPTAFHLHLPWCRGLQPRALPLRRSVHRTSTTPPQVMSPTTTSSRRLLSSSTRSPWPSNGSPKTSTTMTSPSVRRSSMRAEDEPITLKEKACRPVCRRRQWVMTELGDPLFAVTQVTRKVTKFRDTKLKTNRLGLSWTDKGSKSSLTVKRRFKSTNSRLIMTEEVYKSWMKRSSRRKKNFILLKQKNDVDKIINFFMNRY